MPELPEVETVRRGLEESIKNKKIAKVILRRKDLRAPFPKDFAKNLTGRKIKNINRRSKYLVIELDSEFALVAHLGMSGKILIVDKLPKNPAKHDHVLIEFSDGSGIIYNDARRFGLMTLVDKKSLDKHSLFKDLGPEPLSENFTPDILFNALRKKTSPIKTSIMDAHIVVGVGNIYACESLFRSQISPETKANKINKNELGLLVKNIRNVLNEAIDSGGSTLRDYVRSDGGLGYFQHKFNVYGREKEPCYTCGSAIKRIKQQGRSTFYCPECQR